MPVCSATLPASVLELPIIKTTKQLPCGLRLFMPASNCSVLMPALVQSGRDLHMPCLCLQSSCIVTMRSENRCVRRTRTCTPARPEGDAIYRTHTQKTLHPTGSSATADAGLSI